MKNKKIFFLILIIGLIIISFIFFPNQKSKKANIKKNNITTEKIKIENLEKYSSVMIYNSKPYYLLETIVVNDDVLDQKLGTIKNIFYSNEKNIYDDIDFAIYNMESGLEVYSIKDNFDCLAIKSLNNVGYYLYTLDYNNYMNKYNLNKILEQSSEVLVYKDIKNNKLKGMFNIENINSYLKDIRYVENFDKSYIESLISFNINGFIYCFDLEISYESKKAIINDYNNKISKEIEFLLFE